MTSFAPSGTARLAYDVEGSGPPVLLLHAGVTDRRSWRSVVDLLSPTHQVIAFDRRGFGETTYEAETFSHLADVLAVLDDAGIEGPVSVVGCSMGGQVALDLALDHPERVERLVLIGAACRGAPGPEDWPESYRELGHAIEAADAGGDTDTVNSLEAWMWLDGPMAREHRVSGPARELFLDMNGIALAAADPGQEAELPSQWDRLGQISAPTLVMIGDLDCDDVFDTAEGLAEHIPGARLEVLLETAHLPQLESHKKFLEELGKFLA